jgi:phenylalanyl-tRNA synthetase alpha chain
MIDLRENEQKTLQTLKKLQGKGSLQQVITESGLAHAAVMRAALSLSTKKLIKIHEEKITTITLNEEGRYHATKGLPERRLIETLLKLGGEASIENVVKEASLEKNFIPIALGWINQKKWATIDKKQKILKLKQKPAYGKDEELLSTLFNKGYVILEELDKEMQNAVALLKKRKLVKLKEKTSRELELTAKGWELAQHITLIKKEVSQLTPELIVSGKWQQTKLRKFNVKAPVPKIYPGKTHPLRQIIQYVREIFLQMGFTEIRGPIVTTAFWNFDALFQPQDHPAREMMDTFYLAKPNQGKLPQKSIVNKVAKTHENGWITGSKGWGYKWSATEAKRLVLRTHTTAVTIQYLADHKKPPIKVFSVDRVYRNERVDYKHIPEFHQIEGIIMDENVTLRDLMGTLKEFYERLGLKNIRFWPSYFPYTEPSAQATTYIPRLKTWIELCGMGVFRPEVLVPLGIKYPVLAWGGGLERLAIAMLGLDDIRIPYKNDLGWIRETPLCR